MNRETIRMPLIDILQTNNFYSNYFSYYQKCLFYDVTKLGNTLIQAFPKECYVSFEFPISKVHLTVHRTPLVWLSLGDNIVISVSNKPT